MGIVPDPQVAKSVNAKHIRAANDDRKLNAIKASSIPTVRRTRTSPTCAAFHCCKADDRCSRRRSRSSLPLRIRPRYSALSRQCRKLSSAELPCRTPAPFRRTSPYRCTPPKTCYWEVRRSPFHRATASWRKHRSSPTASLHRLGVLLQCPPTNLSRASDSPRMELNRRCFLLRPSLPSLNRSSRAEGDRGKHRRSSGQNQAPGDYRWQRTPAITRHYKRGPIPWICQPGLRMPPFQLGGT